MEMKAYLEGIGRKWWLLGMMALLSWWLGGIFVHNMTPVYTASTAILLNDRLLVDSAFPSGIVQPTIPTDYTGLVASPAALRFIMKTYARFTESQLKKNIMVSTDQTDQILLINVRDISPRAAADIANFLARNFVKAQTANLQTQMNYYNRWLQQIIARLNDQINWLNQRITAATPPPPRRGPAPRLTPQQKATLDQYQSQVNQARHTLYDYQQSLIEVQHALGLVPETYLILQKADVPVTPDVIPLPAPIIQLIALAIGLFLTLCLIISIDFFTPVIRHRGELLRVAGISVMAELPQLHKFERQRLLAACTIPGMWRIKPLRLLCSSLSAIAGRSKGHTILLSSPCRKRSFAALLATFLAHKGHKTLLVDADFGQPGLHKQVQITGPCTLRTQDDQPLSFVRQTAHANLFLLPATATLAQGRTMTSATLMELMPRLQREFDLIVIDAPPLDHPDTHLFATRVAQVVLFVKKRRDRLQAMKATRMACETLKMKPHYVLLT